MRKIKTKFGDIWKIKNDVNGNPRYSVHFLTLGLPSFESTDKTREAGLRKYTGKKFGGCFTFTSYNVEQSLKNIIETLEK